MSFDPIDSPEQERAWLERLPKVELHLHLEGAIPLAALWQLIQKYGGDPSTPDRQALALKFTYTDFPHFIDTWVWKNQFLREYEDFTSVAEAVAQDLAAQNIRYIEVSFSPADFRRFGLEPQALTEAIREGLDRVPGIQVALVADLVRDFGPETASLVLEKMNEVRDLGVIGVGIGGSEQLVPPEVFEGVYERARELGFRTTAHAGEVCGPESVWGVIRSLRTDRIGHATTAREDETLVDYLAQHAIPLELCPVSNLRTGAIGSIEEHPARIYFERGIPICINTDDPALFGTSLADEYSLLRRHLGFTRDDIRKVILQAIDVSWLPDERKFRLMEEFLADPGWTEL
ncbi:hypothetical protein AMJ39_05195 [candidate division TA06 bacterium DG_24]|jgi:adenosine deaminase|uniref:Adenosine deaminase domain-containing protein n=2 Tax=Bacteria division TA06 TaxID=1156500 RepID=A0A0S8G3S9_UNCT6|nr:MAG: hypothetical protein AMJ39_05195 [candidate division TA06 bacterium DG_24]KPK67456.1 MAG: hypothetical protein AMJ82_10635 [candidate division TA06 bacterium SM23_40]